MKKALLAVLATLLALGAAAEEVSSDIAEKAARGWINLREALGEEITAEPESVLSYTANGGKGRYYVVNLQGGGFVVTSGDTEIEPILAYSKTSTFDADENSPMRALLAAGMAARVAAHEKGGTQSSAIVREETATGGSPSSATATVAGDSRSPASQWARLISTSKSGGKRLQARLNSAPADLRVASFVKSKWSQQKANGKMYYNYYTPNNYPCGCVATAFAQTMRYFEFPKSSVAAKTFTCAVSGTSTDLTMLGGTYDWANMPYAPATATYSEAKMLAVAKLTSDAGISVCMSYASGGSGSSSFYVADSLVSTFGYSNAIADYGSSDNQGDKFKKNVLPSLDAKLPVVLGIHGTPTGSATADAGHAILTDGYGYYNGELYIHLNFGWSGSDDAWYTPAMINASDYDFDEITCSVFNIFTNATQYSVIASGRVLDQDGLPVSGADVAAKYGNTTYATATSDSCGVYALILPPTSSTRTYTVTATKSGYTTGERSVSASRTVGDTLIKDGNNYTGSFRSTASNSNSYDNDLSITNINTLIQVATPTFSPPASTFYTDTLSVTLACATAGATIRYTLDGTEPTSSCTAYSAPITISGTTTIKAKAFKSGYVASDTVSATYTMAEKATIPTSTSTAGYRTTLVDLASTVPGAVIRYTVDGSDPTESSEVYTAGTSINVTNATGATTIKARVYAEGYRPSDVFSYDYYVKQFFGPTNGVNAAVWEDTPQNRADHWIFENEEYKEATGLWSNAVEYVDHKVAIDEGNEFIADNPSAARNVTVESTVSFGSVAEDDQTIDGAKAAVRIGTNSCFQVYTTNENGQVWLDTTADGITAVINHDFTVKIELDFTNKMYSAAVKNGANVYVPLTVGGNTDFPFAHDDATSYVQAIGYAGEGKVESIFGSYTNRVVVFVTDEVVTVSDGTATLTASQADWLNARGDHAAVAAVIRTLTSDQFARAYLLNENIMNASYSVDGWGSFEITDIDVGAAAIAVKVKLVRNFAVMDGAKAAPINGTLKVYGGENVTGIDTQIQDYELNDNDVHFRDGEEATFIISRGALKFYKAKIE